MITGLNSQYCQLSGSQKIRIVNIPPISDSVTETAILDGYALSVGPDSSLSLAPGAIAVGAHSLKVIYTNRTGADTLAAAFQGHGGRKARGHPGQQYLQPAGVVITATDQANGGNNPGYAFSKDFGFGSVLQAQSLQNTLTLDTASLQIGNNVYYVRMYSTDIA